MCGLLRRLAGCAILFFSMSCKVSAAPSGAEFVCHLVPTASCEFSVTGRIGKKEAVKLLNQTELRFESEVLRVVDGAFAIEVIANTDDGQSVYRGEAELVVTKSIGHFGSASSVDQALTQAAKASALNIDIRGRGIPFRVLDKTAEMAHFAMQVRYLNAVAASASGVMKPGAGWCLNGTLCRD